MWVKLLRIFILSSAFLLASGVRSEGLLAAPGKSLKDFVESEVDLATEERGQWKRSLMRAFGGEALEPESPSRPEFGVAKVILAHAIHMKTSPKNGVKAAWEGYRGVMGYVPPPVAIRYQTAKLSGHTPKGTMEQMSFFFERFYDDEIAAEFVAYWEKKLAEGTATDAERADVERTLTKTRVLMRPLLTAKLRALTRLTALKMTVTGQSRSAITADIKEIEEELARAFKKVAQSEMVTDASKEPFARLASHLSDIGEQLTEDDKALEPSRFREEMSRQKSKQDKARSQAKAQKALERARALFAEREAARQAEQQALIKKQKAEEARKRALAQLRAQKEEAERAAKANREAQKALRKAREKKRKDQIRAAKLRKQRAEARAKQLEKRRQMAEKESQRAAEAQRQAEQQRKKALKLRKAKEREETSAKNEARRALRKAISAREKAAGVISFPKERLRPSLLRQFRSWKGTPYKWGGETKRKGTDCSGFTQGVTYETFTARLPRTSRLQAVHGIPVAKKDLRPGDLVFFALGRNPRRVTHVGIYLGNDRFAHASSSRGVIDDPLLSSRYFSKRYLRARRFLSIY
ncbi:MAG: NlpC/P60 family protein [Myxococcota bacterium]|nr:NlpC/P60 family protein [Myxococcota bacterium]